MKDKAEVSLSKARKAEMEANHAYEMLKQSIEMELSGMQKRMTAATNERSFSSFYSIIHIRAFFGNVG